MRKDSGYLLKVCWKDGGLGMLAFLSGIGGFLLINFGAARRVRMIAERTGLGVGSLDLACGSLSASDCPVGFVGSFVEIKSEIDFFSLNSSW